MQIRTTHPNAKPSFFNDKEVARKLSLSPSWVRVQRHKRAKGLPHILTIDPRYIGRCPRYLASEVEEFIAAIAAQNGGEAA
ncbi:helix-turn-helix transcriptional regulator [Erythrobacter sanguineus]|uniref:helix-turn-helix transcriptional regulator n=1 Tax=Erythrobacter sanguineus TaxID=198312 RepID=UPI00093277F6|nr:hypothetical protein [Erythrobacter sanguineus]